MLTSIFKSRCHILPFVSHFSARWDHHLHLYDDVQRRVEAGWIVINVPLGEPYGLYNKKTTFWYYNSKVASVLNYNNTLQSWLQRQLHKHCNSNTTSSINWFNATFCVKITPLRPQIMIYDLGLNSHLFQNCIQKIILPSNEVQSRSICSSTTFLRKNSQIVMGCELTTLGCEVQCCNL